MLTPEQIKNLKYGDKLSAEVIFISRCLDGDIYTVAKQAVENNERSVKVCLHPDVLSLPSEYKTVVDARDIFRNMSEGEKEIVNNFLFSYCRETKKQEEMRKALKKMGIDLTNIQPKHDPCRKFKKGDRAKVVERYGRNVTCFPVGRIKVGDIVTVAENESGDVFIKVLTDDGHEMMAPWFMLELVKPVEEMEPYSAREYADFYAVEKDGAQYSIFFKGSYHDNAKAAAEAERDRLNAEYRKEQKCK